MHKRAIAINTIAQIIGKVFSILINLVIVYLLTHHYSVTQFGEYTAVISYLLIFNILADLGLSTILVRDIPNYDEGSRPVFIGNIIMIRLCSLLLSLSLGVILAQFIPAYNEVIKLGVLIGAASTFFLLLATLLYSIFQIHLKLEKSVLSSTTGLIADLIFVIIFIHYHLSIDWAVLALSLGYGVMIIIAIIQVAKLQRISFYFDKEIWITVLKQSITIGGTIIFSTIYFKSDSFILSLMKPYSAVSLYGVPYKILEVLIAIPQMFMAPVFVIMSNSIQVDDIEKFKHIFQRAFDLLLLAGLPMVPGAIFLSAKIIPLYAGNQYRASIDILKILSIAVMLSFIGSSFIFVILLFKKQRYLFIWNIFLSIFNITLNIIFIPKYSFYASAWITVATELLVLSGSVFITNKIIHFIPHPETLLKGFLATAVFTLLMYATSSLNFVPQTLIGLTGYTIVLFATRAVTKQDILEILK